MRAWGPTAAAAVVACLPPAALATGLGCAGFGLVLDSSALAAGGAVAATAGIVAQRSAGRRLRRRLRQERARNRVELHDLHLRLEQATRHLAEAVALAEAATRAMSGRPLVDVAPVAPAAAPTTAAADRAPAAAAPPVVAVPAGPSWLADRPDPAVPAVPAVPVAAPAVASAVAQDAAPDLPDLPRRVAAAVRVAPDARRARHNAEIAGRVAARLTGPASVFGSAVVPATPADLFTPADGLPSVVRAGDADSWFAPVRPGGLPPAPLSPPVGIAVATAGFRPAGGARPNQPALAGLRAGLPTGSGRPPGQRDPVSGGIAVLAHARAGDARLPARLAGAKVVDLSRLAHPAEPALIVVRRGKHVA